MNLNFVLRVRLKTPYYGIVTVTIVRGLEEPTLVDWTKRPTVRLLDKDDGLLSIKQKLQNRAAAGLTTATRWDVDK